MRIFIFILMLLFQSTVHAAKEPDVFLTETPGVSELIQYKVEKLPSGESIDVEKTRFSITSERINQEIIDFDNLDESLAKRKAINDANRAEWVKIRTKHNELQGIN